MPRHAALLVLLAGCGARTELGHPLRASRENAGADGAPLGPCVDQDIAHDPTGAAAIAVDGDTVFWTTTNGQLWRHDASGNTKLADDAYSFSLALDATYVYAPSSDGTRIWAVPRAGGPLVTRVPDLQGAFAVVLRDDTFYVEQQKSIVSVGPVEAPAQRTTILDGLDGPEGFAVDDENVYVVATTASVGGKVVTRPVLSADRALSSTQRTPTVLATTVTSVAGLAVSATDVYFADVDAGYVVFAVPKGAAPSRRSSRARGSRRRTSSSTRAACTSSRRSTRRSTTSTTHRSTARATTSSSRATSTRPSSGSTRAPTPSSTRWSSAPARPSRA